MLYRPHAIVVTLVLLALTCLSNASAVAGTTGGVSGRVLETGTPGGLAGAKVTLVSPSQSATALTDPSGRFSFVSLAPDTYTLSIEKTGYEAQSIAGISVLADAQQTLSFSLRKAPKEIGRVSARAPGDLVKPGTTADVYSVNAAQQDRLSSLGGGGNQNSAYSAIASVAGAYVPPNQTGYNEAVHIRGGDSDQVGYEFDGIPINRGFDNYPSGSTSSLGQQELQVYTGASPANSEAQGLAGFVNQVIKTGTYPGTAQVAVSLGGPAFYHSLNVEFGGANKQRTFSYYVATGGFNQDERYVDQFNAQSYGNAFGPILFQCGPVTNPPPSCFQNGRLAVGQAPATDGSNSNNTSAYALGPLAYGGNGGTIANNATRSTVVNLHFGIPHKNGSLRDDVQLLYDNDQIYSTLFSSALDEGLANSLAYNGGGSPAFTYSDAWQYNGQLGSFLPANAASLVTPYLFPASPRNRAFGGTIPLDARDVQFNQQGIFKLQYQKNFSSQAYLRLYGYTYYSDYIAAGPNSSFQPYTGLDSGDYELSAHTRGLSATFADQLDGRNLLELQGSYTTSRALRMYNTQVYGSADNFAVLVNRNDLTSGTCYSLATGVPSATTCDPGTTLSVATPPTFATLSGIGCTSRNVTAASCAGATPPVDVSGLTCGTGPCGYYVVENGQYGEYNQVKPVFTGLSLTDQYRPTDKLLLNLGVRLDHYSFAGADTTGSPARAFWFNAYNQDTCFDTNALQLVDKTTLGIPIPAGCSTAGTTYQPLNLQNVPSQRFTYDILQPRLGFTYTFDPNTVVRGSYGKYNEQPSSAYQQYGALQQNLPEFIAPAFYSYGFTTPGHPVRPSVSYNADFSLEHQFKGTDLSFKLTPFYRQTRDQVENFTLDIQSGLVSGLNIGKQTSEGFEFALNKGDFGRNGIAAQLSFAYTNSYVQFSPLSNGSTIVSPINAAIKQYNAYTSFCAANPADARCGATTTGTAAAACFSAGAPTGCDAAGAVANPYWNAAPQPLLDPNGKYVPYSIFPAGIGTGVNSFEYPYVATLVLNYKHDRFTITPSLQFQAGNRYGAPETTPGIDPATCGALAAASVAGDSRYPYGAAGGAPYDATTCGAQLTAIPDPYTGKFDAIGAFREPAQLLANVRLSYAPSKNIEVVTTLSNVIDRCFGGQKTAFTYYSSNQVCSYGGLTNSVSPVGNVYNPTDNVQTFLRYPYQPSFGSFNGNGSSILQPFGVYFSVRAKI